MNDDKMKIIYIGTSEFSVPILQALADSEYAPVAVITSPDKPAGRKKILTPSPVKEAAIDLGLPVWQPTSLKGIEDDLIKESPDILVLASYGKIVPNSILRIPKYGPLNIHPSLLPKYRGPSPLQSVILSGDDVTGTTVMLMDDKIDHGPILSQRKYQISDHVFSNGAGSPTTVELSKELSNLSSQLLIETIPQFVSGSLSPSEQDHSSATYTNNFTRGDGKIDWSEPARYIERKVRAFHPWPGCHTFLSEKRVKILDTKVIEMDSDEPGKIDTIDGEMVVSTGKNRLMVLNLQVEGKTPQRGKDLIVNDIITDKFE